ncbi:MAG TPA: hypothetical protein VGT02_11930 [Methylomirabilota bacterium]|jgi:hypothetical protein|nr:hypothetical protein [Methylomirabilota bacterium]
MNADIFLRDLVTRVEPNATVVAIEERDGEYHVSLAGTTGVVADCTLPRDAVEAAERWGEARRRVASVLKRCADDVVAPIADGRA